MRRAFCLLAPLLVIGYLYAQWSDWFSQIELESVWKRPLISDPIDLVKKDPIEWVVPKEDWIIKDGEADLALSLNLYTIPIIPAKPYQFDLRIRVRAQGRVPGGEWRDRLIRDGSFTTNEPFSKNGSDFWSYYGQGRLEYCLGRVRIVAEEELRIIIEVLVQDDYFRWAMPRLKLVGTHDIGEIGYPSFFRGLLRVGGYWVCICLVVVLAFLAYPWKRTALESMN